MSVSGRPVFRAPVLFLGSGTQAEEAIAKFASGFSIPCRLEFHFDANLGLG